MLRSLAPIVVLLLAGCAAPREPVWINAGTPALQAEQEYLACEAQAQQDFPDRTRAEGFARVTIGTAFCRSNVCVGANNAPDVFDRDRADGLRTRLVAACMQARGYREERLPACPAGPVTALQSQPFDIRGLCLADGRLASPLP